MNRLDSAQKVRARNLLVSLAAILAAAGSASADWTFQTNTPWFQQENDLTPTNYPNFGAPIAAWYGCGAATAKMIVESAPIGGTVRTLAQYRTDIEAQRVEGPNGNNRGGYYTDPVAEKWAIGQYDTRFGNPNNHNRWRISAETDVRKAGGKLAMTFDQYRTPSATLVYGGNHWIAVTGVTTDVQPTTGAFSVKTFRINDPDAASERVGRRQLISWDTWKRSYQTPSTHGTTYLGKMVSVVDPDPEPENVGEPNRPATGTPIADAAEAVQLAETLLSEAGLSSDFAGMSALLADEVGISHTADTGWWVGFGSSQGSIRAGVLVDSDQRDLLVAGWNDDLGGGISWGERTQFWPYLGTRVPTAAPETDTSGLFQVYSIPEPASLLLLALGSVLLAYKRRD